MKQIAIALVLLTGISNIALAQKDVAVKAFHNENYRAAANLFKTLVTGESTGENFYYLGNAYGFLGKWDSARWAYDAGVKADAKYGPNYAGLAKTYLSQNNATKAQEYFDMARTTTNPNKDVNYYAWLADAYINSANPNPQEAVNLLNKAKEINYKDGRLYLLLGDAYYKMVKGGDAVNNYDLALQYNPALNIANVRIGDVWTDARRYPEALAAYEKALAANGDFAPALKGLSNLYYMTGQFDKARETLNRYLAVGEVTEDIRYRQLDLSYRAKDYANVKQQAEELLRVEPNRTKLKRIIAYTDYELGNYESGLKQLNEFMATADAKTVNAEDYVYLARFERHLGNDSLVILNYEKALTLDTARMDLYDTLATFYYGKKDFGRAADYYVQKIEASEKPAIQDYFALGRAYYFDSAYAKADTAFMKVTELSSVWPVGYLWRARASLGLEPDPEKPQGLATPHYQKVIETASTDSVKYKRELVEALKYFGNLATLNERYDEAMTYYNRALALNPDEADIRKTVEAINESRKKKG